MDVAEEEITEDFQKLGAAGVLNVSLKDAGAGLLYRKRVGWLFVLVVMNLIGGAAIALFEQTIEATLLLVFFLPLVIGTGGNAGAQAATLMVRALATGDVQLKDWFKLWGKELGVAALLGVSLALVVAGVGFYRGGADIAIIIAISMVAVVVFGSMMGMVMPFILTRFNLDPATASVPLITSIADIGGILIYLTTASLLLSPG
jgi:magnesium transporter